MISTRYLTTQFGSRYLGSSRIAIPDFLPTRAEIVDGQPALRKDTLYLCTQEDVIEDRIPECDGQTVLLICGCGQGFKASLIPEECVGLMLSCPLTEALNFTLRLSGIETDYTDRLQMLIAGGGNAHQFVSEIAMIAGGDTILLDEGMIEEGSINCPNCNELLEFDYDDLTIEEVEELNEEAEKPEEK